MEIYNYHWLLHISSFGIINEETKLVLARNYERFLIMVREFEKPLIW